MGQTSRGCNHFIHQCWPIVRSMTLSNHKVSLIKERQKVIMSVSVQPFCAWVFIINTTVTGIFNDYNN